MVQQGRGVFAADESASTIAKRFKAINVESREENRCTWCGLLVITPGQGEYFSGIILFEETLIQKMDTGLSMPESA